MRLTRINLGETFNHVKSIKISLDHIFNVAVFSTIYIASRMKRKIQHNIKFDKFEKKFQNLLVF